MSIKDNRVLCCSSGNQPIIIDKNGKEILKFIFGDMYLWDINKTKGHT